MFFPSYMILDDLRVEVDELIAKTEDEWNKDQFQLL